MGAQSAKRRFPARADPNHGDEYGLFRWDEYGSTCWNKFSQLELLDYDEQPADRRGPRPAGIRNYWRERSASERSASGTAPASAYCTRGDFGGERAYSDGYIKYLQYLHEHLRIGMRVRATEGDRRGDLGTFHDGPVLPGWVSALSVSHSKSVLYGVFAWARRAQNVGYRPGQISARAAGNFSGTSTVARPTRHSAKWSSSTTTSSRRTAVARGPRTSQAARARTACRWPRRRGRCYGTRSPLQDLTRIIKITYWILMVHGSVRHRRFHGNCSAAGIRA
jgi:hypothetical protein